VTIGMYRVLGTIGEGGMGTVYVGEHVLLGRKAAIKVLLPSLSANEDIVARFFNEARAVTQIADPGIVQVFDFGHHPEVGAFIVMELLEGEPLDRRLKRVGRLGLIECLRLVRLIATSLGAAHAKGIIHRDLKPEAFQLCPVPAMPCARADESNALIKSSHSKALEANLAFGVAAAAAIGAGVLWFTGSPHAEEPRRVSVAPSVTPGQLGLTVGGRF
jgi:serine/threonine protein kinase